MLATVLVLAGCTQGMSDLRAWVAQEKAKKGVPIQPLPVIKTFETFKYEDQDQRDPFSPEYGRAGKQQRHQRAAS